MTVNSFKMGPGTLKLGTAGAFDVSAQVTACTVAASESVDTEDDVPVLTGEVLTGDETVTLEWSVSGNFVQDIAVGGVVAYTWTNASDEVDFEFIPNTTAGRKVTGVCRLVPVSVGGDVKTKPRSDFEWAIIGTPVLGAAS